MQVLIFIGEKRVPERRRRQLHAQFEDSQGGSQIQTLDCNNSNSTHLFPIEIWLLGVTFQIIVQNNQF
jgi:hypothetical protein